MDRSEYKKNWYLKNKDRILKKQKDYVESNKEEYAEYQKLYRGLHKEEISTLKQKHYQTNKTEIDRKHNEYDKARRKTDPAYKLRKNCSSMIWQVLKSDKNNKSILNYLPYTMKELKKHLESQFSKEMSWDNYGVYWHIDHVIPQSYLVYSSMDEENFQKCWSLDNLQPLEALENIKKSNKLDYLQVKSPKCC